MSKSKGNAVEPFAVIDKYGVDALRWQFFTGTPFGEPKNFDENDVAQALRKTHLIIYNSFVFLKTYAAKAAGGSPGAAAAKSPNILDKWILSRLAELAASVTKKLDRYEVREAALEIDAFVDDLSRWYIRRSRRRFQRPESAKDHKAASATLECVILELSTIMAPFTPFVSEALYAALGGKRESVHLDRWPVGGNGGGNAAKGKAAKRPAANIKLNEAMTLVRALAAAGLAKRAEAGVKVRQPLASLSVGTKFPAALAGILADEVNVKKVIYDKKIKNGVALDTVITAELREEGLMRDVARLAQELRQKADLSPKDRIVLVVGAPDEIKKIIAKHEAALRSDVGARDVQYGRSDKFTAEAETKIEGQPFWLGLRKV